MKLVLLAFALLNALPCAAPAQATPTARVVSLNLCADEYLLTLAPDQAVAVSVLAADPALSIVADAARRVPRVRADAEAVLELAPSLVLVGPYGTQTTIDLLRRRGFRIERVGLLEDFTAIAAETRRLGALLGASARAESLVEAMWATLAAAPRTNGRTAVMLEARGYVAGPGTLADTVLRAAGFTDAGRNGQPGLEALVAHPPDLLVTATAPDYPSLATDLLVHPALAGIPRRTLPMPLLLCGGPWTAAAVGLLAP